MHKNFTKLDVYTVAPFRVAFIPPIPPSSSYLDNSGSKCFSLMTSILHALFSYSRAGVHQLEWSGRRMLNSGRHLRGYCQGEGEEYWDCWDEAWSLWGRQVKILVHYTHTYRRAHITQPPLALTSHDQMSFHMVHFKPILYNILSFPGAPPSSVTTTWSNLDVSIPYVHVVSLPSHVSIHVICGWRHGMEYYGNTCTCKAILE